ncbi:MAG: hypothetical protein FJ087_08060 [Deltaproteobacteria bacterium]|nr:hypothetical protein [Deltaproteobacteria bacterium]
MTPEQVAQLSQVIAQQSGTPAGAYLVVGILGALLVAVLGFAAWLLKDLRGRIDDDIKKNAAGTEDLKDLIRDEVKKVWEHISRTERNMPLTYVLRDDFIRSMNQFDRKLDRVLERMDEMDGNRRRGGDGGPAEAAGA